MIPTKVLMYDKHNRLIKTYSKMADTRVDGYSAGRISEACKNGKMYKGYFWKTPEDHSLQLQVSKIDAQIKELYIERDRLITKIAISQYEEVLNAF